MKVLVFAGFLAFALPLSTFADGIATPEDFGRLFCKGSIDDDMTDIEANFSPSLALVVAEAVAKNTQAEVSVPDEKPPLGDGLPWRSWQDYADGCTVGDVTMAGDKARVAVEYSFTDSPDANYADELVLVPSANAPGTWELDDIILRDDGSMRRYLADAFAPSPSN